MRSKELVISEVPAPIWELQPTFTLRIDRSSTTVAEYLEDNGIIWKFGNDNRADIRLYKEGVGGLTLNRLGREMSDRLLNRRPFITLVGEPREFASAAYCLCNPKLTLAVAPGYNLKRLYFASEWIDPQLEEWSSRLNRVCWIARPTPERIEIARKIIESGVPLDIYSRQSWPLSEWKGYADDEVEMSRRYRYRLVCENSCQFGYHSEKLFNSIRSGCVTFYRGDPSLDLSHAEGAFLRFEPDLLRDRDELGRKALHGIERFMFSSYWEVYSFRSFYDRIIELARELHGHST